MDPIEFNKNCVTTECGHVFHANCLMTSIAHNGFGCPYCRTAMADEVPDDDSEDDEYEDEDEDEENLDEDVLRGFRFFINNLTGEEHDEEDIKDEETYLLYDDNSEPEEPRAPVPTASFIAQKLIQQGVTMEDIVKTLLVNHEEYDSQNEQLERAEDELFGKMRIIISNFTPEQNV